MTRHIMIPHLCKHFAVKVLRLMCVVRVHYSPALSSFGSLKLWHHVTYQ